MARPKKITVLFVAVLVVCSLLAGCGQNSAQSTEKGSSGSNGASSAQGDETAAPANEVPRPDKLVVISGQTIGTNEPEKQKAFIEAFKKLSGGVELEIINNSEAGTLATTRVAAGDQTDIYIGNATGLIQKEAVVEIQQSWIDASQYLKEVPEIYWDRFKVSGKKMTVPYRSMMKTALFIRQDWLDKLGLQAPVTIDDFYDVAKAFTLNDPDGNGKKDTYGFSGQNEWDTCTYFFFPIQDALCKFTGGGSTGVYDPDSDKMLSLPFDREDEYKAYLSYLQKCYKEGILEPQIFTNKEQDHENLFLTGKTGILCFYCVNTDEILEKTKAVNPEAKVSLIAPPTGPQGGGLYALISNVGMSVLKTTKDPEAAVKYFCDVIHSPEGQQLLCYGPEGVNWKMENGVPKATVTNPSMGLNPTLVINQSKFKPIIPFSPETEAALKLFDEHFKVDQALPNLPVNDTQEDETTLFMEYYGKIITGEMDVDAGIKEWKAKFLEKGFNKYYDDVNTTKPWK